MKKKWEKMLDCDEKKHPYHAFFKKRKIPFKHVAKFLGISTNRLSQILCLHTTFPRELKTEMDKLVRQIRIEEGTHVD